MHPSEGLRLDGKYGGVCVLLRDRSPASLQVVVNKTPSHPPSPTRASPQRHTCNAFRPTCPSTVSSAASYRSPPPPLHDPPAGASPPRPAGAAARPPPPALTPRSKLGPSSCSAIQLHRRVPSTAPGRVKEPVVSGLVVGWVGQGWWMRSWWVAVEWGPGGVPKWWSA